MYSLFRELGVQMALRREAVPFAAAFIIAEMFYKWKSFTLECIGFLITWLLLSYIQSLFVKDDG
ncbi:hypothetical protein [uncultured Roseobacter sp.]|uniref:hypothetical protein n=1 Tax=uncultured Roseobacter sp. TaxID=114847 RepID=UPI00262890CC|nr:hypothetical protein [uncultured Roseobacter sp.]